MSLFLYINGQLADLDAGQTIAQTRQVNDLNSLDNRQTSYTNKFKLPKTANNTRIMEYLTVTGNTSNIPYQKNKCSLFSDTGECFVYNGQAVITDGGDSYDAVLYDGIIDLYKAIENKTLADVGLGELDHTRSIETVIGSWNNYFLNPNNAKYLYILADYNGKTGTTNTIGSVLPVVNVDYLVPSVNVKWLFNKIFEKYNGGVLPVGSVFDMPYFKNLWMTFPKAQSLVVNNDHLLFESNNYNYLSINAAGQNNANSRYFCRFNTTTTNELVQTINNTHLKVSQTAIYKIVIKVTLFARRNYPSAAPHLNSLLRICKNASGLSTTNAFNNGLFQNGYYVLGEQAKNLDYGTEYELTSVPFQLQANDSICVMATLADDYNNAYAYYLDNPGENKLEVKLYRVDGTVINFNDALADFPVKDFLNEVVYRFGLTLFKDKYTNKYTFLTLQEQLQSADVVNWSSKFSKKISENYIYGSYAQRNWFRYNYNDKGSAHNDFFLDVPNVNLADSKEIVKSKIYSPERIKSNYLNATSNVYKLWDKEVVEDPAEGEDPVTYKPLDKRYYFLRAIIDIRAIKLKSDNANLETAAVTLFRESYYKLPFADIVYDYYTPVANILKKAQIVTTELWLTEADMVALDFKKLYYLEQLSSYFIINKINNYTQGKVTKCELVRVQYDVPVEHILYITDYTVTGHSVTIYFEWTDGSIGYTGLQETSTDGITFNQSASILFTNHVTKTYAPGTYYVRFSLGQGTYSNTIVITVPV